MLKKRAKKAPDITEDIWKLCNKENRAMYDEYFSTQKQHSPTLKKSKRRIYFIVTNTETNGNEETRVTPACHWCSSASMCILSDLFSQSFCLAYLLKTSVTN